jgi:hypothetical protein
MAKRLSDERVQEMYARYEAGASLAHIGKVFRRDRRSVREIFERRGLHVRPLKYLIKRNPKNGQILGVKPATNQEIDDRERSQRCFCAATQ